MIAHVGQFDRTQDWLWPTYDYDYDGTTEYSTSGTAWIPPCNTDEDIDLPRLPSLEELRLNALASRTRRRAIFTRHPEPGHAGRPASHLTQRRRHRGHRR